MFSTAEYAGMGAMVAVVACVAFVILRLDSAIVAESTADEAQLAETDELTSAVPASGFSAGTGVKTGPGKKHQTRRQRKGRK